MDSLQDRVTYLREASGRSSSAVARAAGLNRGVVRLLELGSRQHPAADTLAAICRATGAELGWLATGQGEPPSVERVRARVDAALETSQGAA